MPWRTEAVHPGVMPPHPITEQVNLAMSEGTTQFLAAIMVPVVTATIGGIGLLIKDRRANRNIDHNRRRVVEQSILEVQFLTNWIQSQQLLGPLEAEMPAREWLARCYESAEAASLEETVERKVNLRRIFLFRHLRGWSANYYRFLFWLAILWINVILIMSVVIMITETSASAVGDDALGVSLIIVPSVAVAAFFRYLSIVADKAAKNKDSRPPPNWN